MARTINSPGIQITETDLSLNQEIAGGTTVFVPGFASQGPTDEVLLLTSVSELEQVYGAPESPAERYFHYTCRELLNSPATLLTTRLPYGSGSGVGFSTQYSALLYPAASSSTGFSFGQPKHITFDEPTYNKLVSNNFTWAAIDDVLDDATYISDVINAGLIIINNSQTTVNENLEGLYVSITDNNEFGPASDFTAVNFLWSLTGTDAYFKTPETKLSFALSGTIGSVGSNSVSEAIEALPTYNFGDAYYKDSFIVTVAKVRNSIYEPDTLTYSIAESFIGSLDSKKKSVVAGGGGISKSFFLEDVVNNSSSNIKVFVHPDISQRTNWTSLVGPIPNKEVRTAYEAEALYPLGVWKVSYNADKDKVIGNIVAKVQRSLTHVETTESVTLDIVCDAGLSTIFAATSASDYYDDRIYTNTAELSTDNSVLSQRWRTTFNIFNNFVTNTRRDCVFIADPLRHIFINGEDTKTLAARNSNFSQTIYTPLKNCYSTLNSNYSTTYANWIKIYDAYADGYFWQPMSGYAASVFARSDAATQPWIAPAGLNRGVMNNIVDIAFNPNQKQRDFLYTISLNPVVMFAGDGYVIYGQKTLQSKPSAFDRINVRRLFLTLERAVQKTLKYFVFEPNTEFTRTRLKNTVTPIFDLAKNTEGLYDYLIVCDERNNTPEVIDRNELAVDIYIKPVRAAEFILVNFIATRTGQDFQELI